MSIILWKHVAAFRARDRFLPFCSLERRVRPACENMSQSAALKPRSAALRNAATAANASVLEQLLSARADPLEVDSESDNVFEIALVEGTEQHVGFVKAMLIGSPYQVASFLIMRFLCPVSA